MIDRSQVESFLNMCAKFDGAREVAKAVVAIDDLNNELSTAQAKLAQAKQAHANELGEHAEQMAHLKKLAEAEASDIVQSANAEAQRVIGSVHADVDKMAKAHAAAVESRMAELNTLAGRKTTLAAERESLEAGIHAANAALATRKAELAEAEAALAKARESIAALLNG